MYVYVYTHTHIRIYTSIYIHTHTHPKPHTCIYTHVNKAKECIFLYHGGLPICHKPDCRKDLENPLLDSEDRQTTFFSFRAVSSNTQNM